MSETSDDRRIEEIRNAIAAGTYRVDALDVADAVLEQWRSIDRVDPHIVEGFLTSLHDASYSTSNETDSVVSNR